MLAKAHYPELDLDLITFGIPESSEDGAPMDEAAIRQSVLGYDQLCALGTQLNVYMKHTICQGLRAKLQLLSPQLPMVLMAVMKPLLLPQSPESCPMLWQEKTMHQFGP
jgi:hypothetical protein